MAGGGLSVAFVLSAADVAPAVVRWEDFDVDM
jgi:hypothetical protein